MDLYIQIGVLLLFLAALSLFIYIYTAPAQQFTQKINETNQKINDRLVTVEGLDLAPLMNNVSSPGTTIYPLIRDSRASKIAILVQTKNSQGLVVNYGYQLRGANYKHTKMIPHGNSGVGGGTGTDFEKNYVTTVNSVFGGIAFSKANAESGTLAPTNFGQSSFLTAPNVVDKLKAIGDTTGYPPSSATGNPDLQFASTPKVQFSDPTVTYTKATETGRTFSSNGFLYTDNVLKMDAPVNDNFSYADNQGSLYRFNQNSAYYSTLILNANNDIVGVYIEEHGVNPQGAVLAQMMYDNGTITQLY